MAIDIPGLSKLPTANSELRSLPIYEPSLTDDQRKMVVGMNSIIRQYPYAFLMGHDQHNLPFLVSRGPEDGYAVLHILVDTTGVYSIGAADELSPMLHDRLSTPGAIEAFRSEVNSQVNYFKGQSPEAIRGQVNVIPTKEAIQKTGIITFTYLGISKNPGQELDSEIGACLKEHSHKTQEDVDHENSFKILSKVASLVEPLDHPGKYYH